ncbi:CBN-XNP-1 protein [Caenorhabditis brenneri]|uniref:CBN-XNP-1 protein n=1 Tax=Caenorhabditis brenneri TaxID=135651 RepID=G0MNX0_CAEBE|nr:CBN-XNP-1 protein [Caenorhabditis brenneri]
MKVVSESEDESELDVIEDEDLELAAAIEKERKEKRAKKLNEKREKEGKPPPKRRGRPPTKKARVNSSDDDEEETKVTSKKKKTRKRTESPPKSAKKKKKRNASSESEEESEESEEERKPKLRNKKRQPKSSESDRSDSEEDEKPKKIKKKQLRKSVDSDESDDDEELKKRKKSSTKKRRVTDSDDSEAEKKKKRTKKSQKSDDDDDDEAPKKTKNKAQKKRSKESSSEEDEDSDDEKQKKLKKTKKVDSDEDEAPKEKTPTRRRGKVESSEDEKDSESEEDDKKKKKTVPKSVEKKKKKSVDSDDEEVKVNKKATKRKRSKSSSEEKSDSEDEKDEPSETKEKSDSEDEMPKKRQGVKKQVKSKASSDDDESDEEVMPQKKKRAPVVVMSESESEKSAKSGKDSEDDDEEEEKNRKSNKKANKKKARSESESDGDDSSDGSIVANRKTKNKTPKKEEKKKKGIIMDSSKLAKETVDAEKAEKERRKRLEKKQKEFNGITLEEGEDLTEVLTGTSSQRRLKSVILDPDASSDPKVPVEVHSSLVRILKPHQAHGIQFMYDCAFESIDRMDKEGSGGILAHCMGLGKTLQVITFLHTVMMHEKLGEKCKHVLVVVPKNVIINWFKEFQKWLEDNDEELATITVDELDSYKTGQERMKALKQWHNSKTPSVMIIGYDMFRILTCEDDPKKKKTQAARKLAKLKDDFRKYLQDPGPDMVVCDEAHKLKNDESALSKTMVKIATRRRICLTGTPLQNNLMEYHCMVNFVKPGLLGTKNEFANRFVNIINRGRTKDASQLEVSFMKRRCHVLYEHLKKCVDRKDYRVLTEAIPPKQEYVINVRLTERQCKLYKTFLQDVVGTEGLSKRLLPDYHMFSRIWTHPFQLILHEHRLERERVLREEAEEEAEFIDDEGETDEESEGSLGSSSESESSFVASSDEDDGYKKKKKKSKKETKPKKTRRGRDDEDEDTAMNILQDGIRQSRRLAGEDADLEREATPEEYNGWFAKDKLVTDDDRDDFTLSNKLVLLMEIIKKCEEIGDKLLVFSQSLESLALIKRMLEYMAGTGQWFADGHEALNAEGETWSWLEGEDYMTIDGSVQSVKRDAVQTTFNDPENMRARLMLISTRAGSLGTNMVAANRVIIFDACWNPSHDTQSLFRVYRFGQTKPVYIYRFIAQGTMEERIYKRQVTKESTSMRVVDEAQIQRHYLGNDLTELYQFTPSIYDPDVEIACAPPKDRLLADVIHQNQAAVVDYIEHDTLFANQEEEKLSEQEMKDAWADYEKDKSGVPMDRVPYHLGVRPPGIIIGQQTQAILQNRALETQRLNQIQNDVLFKELNKMRHKDIPTFLKIILLRNLLEQVLPFIPDEMRGGMTEFNTHFIRLVHESDRKQETAAELLRKSLESFKTVIRMIRTIPTCKAPLDRIAMQHPYLFQDN